MRMLLFTSVAEISHLPASIQCHCACFRIWPFPFRGLQAIVDQSVALTSSYASILFSLTSAFCFGKKLANVFAVRTLRFVPQIGSHVWTRRGEEINKINSLAFAVEGNTENATGNACSRKHIPLAHT